MKSFTRIQNAGQELSGFKSCTVWALTCVLLSRRTVAFLFAGRLCQRLEASENGFNVEWWIHVSTNPCAHAGTQTIIFNYHLLHSITMTYYDHAPLYSLPALGDICSSPKAALTCHGQTTWRMKEPAETITIAQRLYLESQMCLKRSLVSPSHHLLVSGLHVSPLLCKNTGSKLSACIKRKLQTGPWRAQSIRCVCNP